ncbi:hypothetical protein J4573_01985 [Actinomadura barringtoniae]|uniref:Uncharacterized protein n=1 Tax=Actinomadura barringtoniae TaxID=1427535 RepID=A0A939PAS3_9ACTN|nr:hypothetical protein [Actinomadura barringtoniae]MBO2445849.1 hypothetical protein [Actinomadura barringtoniae]
MDTHTDTDTGTGTGTGTGTRAEARSAPEHRPGPPQRPAAQLVFAAFSIIAALLLTGGDATPGMLFAAGCYVLAAALIVTCVSLPARFAAPARRTLIVFHLVFIPTQFLFLFVGDLTQVAGMVLGAVAVGRMRPRFPRLRRGTRRVWLVLHVGFSVGWLGLSLAMSLLAIAGATADGHAVRHGAYELMHVFDLAIVIPSVLLSIITGLVVSLGTKWGLIKHWWVLIKFVISLVIPAIATVESSWIEELQRRTRDPAGEPGGLGVALVVCMLVYLALLWTAVALSVVKPGGKTRLRD